MLQHIARPSILRLLQDGVEFLLRLRPDISRIGTASAEDGDVQTKLGHHLKVLACTFHCVTAIIGYKHINTATNFFLA